MASETTRMVVVGLDDILRLFKDYAGQVGIPADSKPVKLMMNQQSRKIGIIVDSDAWTEDQPAMEVKFDIRRIYGVGGN